METDPENRSQRARLTCAACHRRKIKCDKNIPCDSCTRRGIADSCHRGETVPIAGPRGTPSTTNDTVQFLLQRVSHLEAQLHEHGRNFTLRDEDRVASVESSPSVCHAQPDTSRLVRGSSTMAAEELDAATVLEFLAWGRKKDSNFVHTLEHYIGPRQLVVNSINPPVAADPLTESFTTAQLDVLETLLPRKTQILQLVEFHNNSVLWYHGSYCSRMFSDDLTAFLNEYGASIMHDDLNLQWLALLFAVLTGSMTCASPVVCQSWGFSAAEQPILSSRWYDATVACLNLSRYMETHTVYSVQAIATLTISAHILGNSNSQSVLLASAGRIAQSLGLHRLGAELGEPDGDASIEQRRKSEAGKRLFIQLCTQDWFSIPFSETYTLGPRFISKTIRPLNCNDDDMVAQPDSVPTQASYCNYRYDIASLMPQLLDAMADCNTPYTRYEKVLMFDDKMRKLATASMPTFLNKHAPVASEWPAYVGWARRSLTICASHKIIMIHRKFIGLSFTNTAFAFTRRTCLAAAKTILREALGETKDTDPVLWIDQAFSVAAGIILSLDMLYRDTTDREFMEHKQLVSDTIQYLERFQHNKIATRGVQLLLSLQQNLHGNNEVISSGSRKRRHMESEGSWPHSKRTRGVVDMSSVIETISHNLGVTSPPATSVTSTPSRGIAQPPATVNNAEWHSLIDLLPDQVGLDSQYLFDSFLPT